MSLPSKYGALIPEVSLVTQECPAPARWSCFDGTATEVEVLEFLRALLVLLKPNMVVETGTYLGYGTVHLAEALTLCSPTGMVYTAEVEPKYKAQAEALAAKHNLTQRISFQLCTGEDLISRIPYADFAFIDSVFGGPRIREIRAILPKMTRGGIIAVHDTSLLHVANDGPRNYLLDLRDELKLQLIMFDTPRGLTLLRKPDLLGGRQ